jgi:hypothetical protein
MVAGFVLSGRIKFLMNPKLLRPMLLGMATFGALGILVQTLIRL